MAGSIHQIKLIHLAIARLVVQTHGLRLDGNAALALDIHAVEHLFFHVAFFNTATKFDQAIGKRGFAVINMRDDGEISNMG